MSRYQLLKTITKQAGDFANQYFKKREKLKIDYKGIQDLVSEADRETETLIRQAIVSSFPEDSLLGEEYGLEKKSNKYLWIIDPIDGTSSFLNGLSSWCVSVALFKRNDDPMIKPSLRSSHIPVAGAIFDPNTDELYHSEAGGGAWLNNIRLAPQSSMSLDKSRFGLGYNEKIDQIEFVTLVERLCQNNCGFYRNGSGALMGIYVAASRLVAFYEARINAWDIGAVYAIGKEAGFYVSDFFVGDSVMKGNRFLICPFSLEEEVKRIINW